MVILFLITAAKVVFFSPTFFWCYKRKLQRKVAFAAEFCFAEKTAIVR